MKYITIIIILYALMACDSSKIYLDKNKSTIRDGYFKFSSDSTFYYQKNGFRFKHSEGTWRKNGNSNIILNSNYSDKLLSLETSVDFLDSIKGDSILFSIQFKNMDTEDMKYYKLISMINENLIIETTCNISNFKVSAKNLNQLRFGITTTNNIPARMFDTLFTKNQKFETTDKINFVKININHDDTLFNYLIFKNFVIDFKFSKIDYNKYSPVAPVGRKSSN